MTVVVGVAAIVGGLALVGAVLSLGQRWYSARIGEGLIYDLRTQVFAHVQRKSLAFFTRTQTGALVSRLNNDVIGAQQAFTSTLSGGGVQRDRADPGRWSPCSPVLAGHRGRAGAAPARSSCRPGWSAGRLAAADPGVDEAATPTMGTR